jgi:hypothetical protein
MPISNTPRNELMQAAGGNLRVVSLLEELMRELNVNVPAGIATATSAGADWLTNLSNIPSVISGTTASFTTAKDTKLTGIAAGAQVNVKPDWNAAAGTATEIINKPDVSTYQSLELWREIGVQFNSINYYKIATITVTGAAYTGGFSKIEIIGQGRTNITLLLNAYVNGLGTGFDVAVFSLDHLARLGNADNDAFVLVPNFVSKTATVWYKHNLNAWNTKWISRIDSKMNGATISLTRDAVGVAVLPASDFAVTTTVTF